MKAEHLEAAKAMRLPLPPWTHEELGEQRYCDLATKLGFFNPAMESKDFRPALDPTEYLDLIRAQYSGKTTDKE